MTAYGTNPRSASEHPWSTFVVCCETCQQILLYENVGDQFEDTQFQYAELEYPKSGQFHKSVPESVLLIYQEALRIKQIAPNAFAVQIRRALEAICDDKGAKQGVLQKRLEKLAAGGLIPPVLSEASDALRLLGNIGAHGVNESVHPLQVYAIDDFFRAIVEYVYVAPSKIASFKDHMARYSQLDTKK